MIRHIVLLAFKNTNINENTAFLETLLVPLVEQIKGIINIEIGSNVSDEGRGQGFNNGFTIDFESKVALDNYLIHPEHVKVGEKIVSSLKNGLDGLIVFDINIQ